MRQKIILVIFLAIFLNTSLGCGNLNQTTIFYKSSSVKANKIMLMKSLPSKWEVFVEALILVESNGDAHAIGKANDVGILQLTPVYVTEVNRILGKNKYNTSNRTNIYKSIEMFEILQNHYNSKRSIEKAIKLHNPGADRDYHDKIVSKMRELKKDRNYEYKFSKLLANV